MVEVNLVDDKVRVAGEGLGVVGQEQRNVARGRKPLVKKFTHFIRVRLLEKRASSILLQALRKLGGHQRRVDPRSSFSPCPSRSPTKDASSTPPPAPPAPPVDAVEATLRTRLHRARAANGPKRSKKQEEIKRRLRRSELKKQCRNAEIG